MAVLRAWEKSRIDGVIWHIEQSELSGELRSSLGGTVMTATFDTREGPGTSLSKGLGTLGAQRGCCHVLTSPGAASHARFSRQNTSDASSGGDFPLLGVLPFSVL